MASFVHVSATAQVALTNAYPAQGAIFQATPATVPNSRNLAAQVYLSLVVLRLTTIAGGAASVTWFLAKDLDGNSPITPEQTDTILDHDADGDGSVARTLGIYYDKTVQGDVFLFAKLDAGTANGVGELTAQEPSLAARGA